MADVLWVTGPPGVGKSTVAWSLWRRLVARGAPTAYVDIDQLELVRPDPPGDEGRHRLGLAALARVVDTFAAAGFARAVVSGVMHPVLGPDVAEHGLDIHTVRLRCAPDELVRRYVGRGGPAERVDDVVAQAEQLDRSGIGDVVIDTTARPIAEVVDTVAVLGSAASRPGAGRPRAQRPRTLALPGVLLVGPPGVGTSSVGWRLFARWASDGTAVGTVDADQLHFVGPRAHAPTLRAGNAAAVATAHRDVGVRRLVVIARGPDVADLAAVLPNLRVVRLHADTSDLAARIAAHASGGGPNLAGDDLLGLTGPALDAAITRSVEIAAAMDRAGIGERIDTTGLTASGVVDQVARLLPIDEPGD